MDYTIYKKPQQEIDDEQDERRTYARLVKGIADPVCPYYVKTRAGKNLNVWALKPLQLYAFVKAAHAAGAENSFEILKYIQDEQRINDYMTLLDCLFLVPSEGELMRDFIGSMGGNKLRDKASEISEYMTKVEGRPLTTDEVIKKYAQYEKQQKSENS